jgi:hypothetical protein
MGYDERAAERVRLVLAGRPDMVEQRMVGGRSFLVGGSLCCGVTGTALMVRVGPEGREWALAQPHVRPMVLGGRALGGFVCVESEGYASEAALAGWVQRGLDYVASLSAKAPATSKKRAKER